MKKISIDIIYGPNKKATGYILDITSSGIGFVSSKNIPANTRVDIIPKSSQLVKLKGKIVYTFQLKSLKNGYRSGVKFVASSKKQISSLQKFIEKINKREFLRLGLI